MSAPSWQTTWDDLVAWGAHHDVDPAAPITVVVPGIGEFCVYGATEEAGGIVLVARDGDG